MPQELKDTLYRVLVAVESVESVEMEPARGSAIAAMSMVIVGVYEAGLVDSRLKRIEARLEAKADPTSKEWAS
jgi:cytochrome c biogenesis factor